MKISFIVAYTKNRVIGRDNDMPWHLPDDLRFFKKHTTGKPIIMGRKTWESIGGKPLPKRTNIVISRNAALQLQGATVVGSIEEALVKAKAETPEEAFIIGGGNIFGQCLEVADRLYLTEIDQELAGDTLFPEIDESRYREVFREHHPADEKHASPFDWRVLERK